jgi:hypothetical protein
MTPRSAFVNDIFNYFKTLHNDDYALIVMGDLNEVVGHGVGFSKITSEFGLVDVMTRRHLIKNEVATYARGTTRLDYMFCTANILEAVKSCGVEPFNAHIFSDHRSLFIDRYESALFSSPPPPWRQKLHAGCNHRTCKRKATTSSHSTAIATSIMFSRDCQFCPNKKSPIGR